MGVPDPRPTRTTSTTATTPSTTDDAAATGDAVSSTPLASGAQVTGSTGSLAGQSTAGVTPSPSDPLAASTAATAGTGATSTAASASNDNGAPLQEAQAEQSGGMAQGTKIGIGVGVGVGVAVLIALVALFFIMRKRRRNRYNANNGAEQMRGQPAMESNEPALAAASALGRSPSYRSNNRSSYHSLSPTGPPPVPETTAADPMPEATKGTIPVQPTIIPPSQQSLPREQAGNQTPRGRPSMEAEIVPSPGGQSLNTPAPPYEEAPSPMDEHPSSRPISPVSSVSSMGSRPPSLRRSIGSR